MLGERSGSAESETEIEGRQTNRAMIVETTTHEHPRPSAAHLEAANRAEEQIGRIATAVAVAVATIGVNSSLVPCKPTRGQDHALPPFQTMIPDERIPLRAAMPITATKLRWHQA